MKLWEENLKMVCMWVAVCVARASGFTLSKTEPHFPFALHERECKAISVESINVVIFAFVFYLSVIALSITASA